MHARMHARTHARAPCVRAQERWQARPARTQMHARTRAHAPTLTHTRTQMHAGTVQVLDQGAMMHKGSYIRSGWNVLDLTIVVAGLTDFTLTQACAAAFAVAVPIDLRRDPSASAVFVCLFVCLFVCCFCCAVAVSGRICASSLGETRVCAFAHACSRTRTHAGARKHTHARRLQQGTHVLSNASHPPSPLRSAFPPASCNPRWRRVRARVHTIGCVRTR
jgi:hypothetical protein